MTDTRPQSALREWRSHLGHSLTLTALSAVTAVLAMVGPFNTIELLGVMERIVYWGALVVGGYAIGYIMSYTIIRRAPSEKLRWIYVLSAGAMTGAAMTITVLVLNWFVFSFFPDGKELPFFVGTVMAISLIILSVIDMFNRHLAVEGQDAGTNGGSAGSDGLPPILDRLPLEKRGALVALSVEDHYVRVRTTKGEEMILMRLADAIRETGTLFGDQVHRSHWASFDHVAGVTRQGDRAILQMATGPDIPVSRANLPKLKEAGLMPR